MPRARSSKASSFNHSQVSKKKLDKGWLRVLEAKRRGDDPIRLSHYLQDIEREQVVRLLGMISILGKRKGFTVADDLAFAFGQTRKTLGNLKRRAQNSDGFDAKRKRRNDLGDSIFNSKKKRDQVFTAFNIFKKEAYQRASLIDRPTASDLKLQFDELSQHAKQYYVNKAEQFIETAPNLWNDAVHQLRLAKGAISWERLAGQVAGNTKLNIQIVSSETLRKNFKKLPDFTYKSTKMIPSLNISHKEKRYIWSISFWLFWEAAKSLQRIQIFFCEADEKWFFELVARTKNKSIHSLGIMPHIHACGNERHTCKVHCYASSGIFQSTMTLPRGAKARRFRLFVPVQW